MSEKSSGRSLSVFENLKFWTRYLGGGGLAPQVALETVGLGALAELPAAYLSAGQRRRLSIARLVAVKRRCGGQTGAKNVV